MRAHTKSNKSRNDLGDEKDSKHNPLRSTLNENKTSLRTLKKDKSSKGTSEREKKIAIGVQKTNTSLTTV